MDLQSGVLRGENGGQAVTLDNCKICTVSHFSSHIVEINLVAT